MKFSAFQYFLLNKKEEAKTEEKKLKKKIWMYFNNSRRVAVNIQNNLTACIPYI